MKFKAVLLFGAPGSGKGTQGRILGNIPGFFHYSCGDIFRQLDYQSKLGQKFVYYSSKGQLVPDDLTIDLWSSQIEKTTQLRRYKPEIDLLVLDGIPRNIPQAQKLEHRLDIQHIFHLHCPDLDKIVDRLKRRALKDNRLDDANEKVIRQRLELYNEESRPVLDYYRTKLGTDCITTIDATQWPYQVLRDILICLDPATHLEEAFC